MAQRYIPLAHDRQAEVAFGINDLHQGLLCRAELSCRATFHVAHDELTTEAARRRDAHELTTHGYVHVALAVQPWDFTARFSRAGHSLVGKR